MYLADYHTHTRCSFDSEAPLSDEAAQAVSLGLKELCTTDHCDLIDEHGKRVYALDWTPILEQYGQVSQIYEGKLKLRLGLELGSAHVDLPCARRILSGAPLDFVIGSVHNMSPKAGGEDFYYMPLTDVASCYTVLDDYFASLLELVKYPDTYDVLGHIIYPLRYMAAAGVTLDRYQESMRTLFTAAAQAERGIEVNTCRGQTLAEWLPVLELYRESGGEVVTIGTDAHTARDVGKGIQEAQELLKQAGFRYQAVYRRRIPQFIRL